MLYVTHDQAEALSMSDRIAVVRDGQIVQVASPDDVYRRPANRFVAEFMGDPPLNIITCEVTSDVATTTIALPGGTVLQMPKAAIAAGRHWLGIRPHDVELAAVASPGTVPAILRFVENFGARHVLHAEYAGDLVRIEAMPAARSIGAMLHLRFSEERLLLIDRISERVVPGLSSWRPPHESRSDRAVAQGLQRCRGA